MLNSLHKKYVAQYNIVKTNDNMPKFVILNVKVKESRNWEIFTHNIFGHKLEKWTLFVNRFLYFSYVKLLP